MKAFQLVKYGASSSLVFNEVDLEKPDTLIPYKDLTQDTVIGWVKAKLEAQESGTVAKIEAAIDANINLQKTPTHGTGTPWG